MLSKAIRKSLQGCQGFNVGTTMALERGGSSLRAGMGQPDLFPKKGCQFSDYCFKEKGQTCEANNVVYSLFPVQHCTAGPLAEACMLDP